MSGYGVETTTGSIYVVTEDEEGRRWLTAQNVPNPASEKMPADVAEPLYNVHPWPPAVGEAWRLSYPSPKGRKMVRLKTTSAVTRVWEL